MAVLVFPIAGAPAGASAQSVFQNSGGQDLILGFRASGGFGKDNSVIVNLGPFATTNSFAAFTLDLGTYLSLAYGGSWASRTDLFWGVVGVELATDRAPDAWLSRTEGSRPPLVGDATSLSEDQLYQIQGALPNITDLTKQSPPYSLTNATVTDSLGGNHAVSANSESVVYGWKYYQENKFGIFSDSIDSPLQAPNSLTVSYYSLGLDPVEMMNVSRSNGVFSFGSPMPTNPAGPGGYNGPWNWAAGSGNWSGAANWTSNQVGSNSFAVGITGTAGGTITNDAVTNIASLSFGNAAGAYTLTGTNPAQILSVTGGITNSSTNTQRIDLSLSGTGGVTQSGAGTTVLSGSNSYAGGTTLSAGAVVIGNTNALGSGAVVVSGASSLVAGVSMLSTTNAMSFNAATRIDTAGNRWTHAGTLSGSGSLTKAGSGTLTIAGSGSSFSGHTALTAGALRIAAGSSLGTGTVTVASGAQLSGSGSVGGIFLQSNGILSAGMDGAVGKLTVGGDLSFAPGGILNWKLSDAGSTNVSAFDSFAVGGMLDLSGLSSGATLQFNILNGISGTANFLSTQNSQWLVASAGSISGFSTNDFSISTAGFTNALGGGAFGFITNATGLYLKFTALGVDPWTGNLSGGSNVILGQTITSTNSAVIGADSSRSGSVAVTNNGVWNVQGAIRIGGATNGSGTLTIGSGGRVSASGLAISDLRGSRGLVVIANGAASNAISLGSGTVSFGSGNGTLQFAQSNAVTLSNAVSGKGTISSTGTGTTTLAGNLSGFSGTNYLSSGRVVLAPGVTNGGALNMAGKGTNVVFALGSHAVLSSTGTHAVAGLLADDSGLSFTNAIRGQVVLSPTGVLRKTYDVNQSVAGFGAGIGAGRRFSLLAGSVTNAATLEAKVTAGALDFKGTYSNNIVLAITDPSFSSIKNTIRWYDPVTRTWRNTVEGNIAGSNRTNALSGMNGRSFAGSFSSFLLQAKGAGILSEAEDTLAEINSLLGSQINVTLAKIMGAFGYDSKTKTSWAVINHNSLYSGQDLGSSALYDEAALSHVLPSGTLVPLDGASSGLNAQAVPEPSSWALMIMGTVLFLWTLVRRGKSMR